MDAEAKDGEESSELQNPRQARQRSSMNARRCVIVGGAPILDYERIEYYLSPDDFYIFCDSGMAHRPRLQSRIDLLIGDFDSYRLEGNADKGFQIIHLPREKDDTDTAYAVKYALKEGYRDFLLVGVYGGLADHSLANLGLLKHIKDSGGNAVLIDDHSLMEVLTGADNRIDDAYPHRSRLQKSCPHQYRYFSLLPIYGKVQCVTIRNAKYNIENADISLENPFTVSNEFLDTPASVSIESGALLLIKSDRH